MEIRLRFGVTLERAIAALEASSEQTVNVLYAGDGPLAGYLEWAEETYRELSNLLSPQQASELVETQRYWRLHQAATTALPNLSDTPAGRWIRELIKREIQSRAELFDQLVTDLDATYRHWRDRGGLIVVPDTNLLIHHPRTVDYIPWATQTAAISDVHVVIPLVVIDELDRLKRTGKTGPIKTRARWTLRTLNELLTEHGQVIPLEHSENNSKTTTLEILLDPPGHRRLPDADSEIIDRAAYLDEISNRSVRVCIATSDTGMILRAKTQDIDTNLLPDNDTDS